MSRFAFPDLVRAFRNGERFGNATMRVAEVGELVLPTGRIVACDPAYLRSGHSREKAYTRAVPPGRYPVRLALLRRDGVPAIYPNLETVACAEVRFRQVPVERWEMALQPGWNPTKLRPGYHLGYGVDSGTGCFLDKRTQALIPVDQPVYLEAMSYRTKVEDLIQLQRLLVPATFGELMASLGFITVYEAGGYPARSAVIDAATGANVICFSSGEGDGCYASYFGLAADGSAACLVTDFGMLVRVVPGTLALAVTMRKRGVIVDPRLADLGIDRIRVQWKPKQGEVVVHVGKALYVQGVRFENRPGVEASCSAGGVSTMWFHLDEPLQPTARVLIDYTLQTEAL
jgi:hypothetical protein